MTDVLQVVEVVNLELLLDKIDRLIYLIELVNTVLLYGFGILAAVGVCVLLYRLLKIFI